MSISPIFRPVRTYRSTSQPAFEMQDPASTSLPRQRASDCMHLVIAQSVASTLLRQLRQLRRMPARYGRCRRSLSPVLPRIAG